MKRWLVMVEPKHYDFFTKTARQLGTKNQILLRRCLDMAMKLPLAQLRGDMMQYKATTELMKIRRKKQALEAMEAKLQASITEIKSGDYTEDLTEEKELIKMRPLVRV